MSLFPTTKTEIAKKVAHMIVAAKASDTIENQMVAHTDYTEDSLTVQVTSFAGGHLIAGATDPYTGRAIDAIVRKYQSWRESKQTVPTVHENA